MLYGTAPAARGAMRFVNELRITKYGNRNWAVWIGEELLAVTVYKKGAKAVVAKLEEILKGQGQH